MDQQGDLFLCASRQYDFASAIAIYKVGQNRTAVFKPEQPIASVSLWQNYPNPCNGFTLITYELPTSAYYTLRMYNMLGKLVLTLHDGPGDAGSHSAPLRVDQLTSGVYFYTLKVGQLSLTRKMVVLK